MKLVVLFHNAAAMATGHSFIHSLQHTHTQWDVIGRTNKIKHHSVNRFKTELEILKQILHLNN